MAVDVDELAHGLGPALGADQEEDQQMADMGQHGVVRPRRVRREQGTVDRLGDDLALVEALHQVHLGQVLEDREERHGREERPCGARAAAASAKEYASSREPCHFSHQ